MRNMPKTWVWHALHAAAVAVHLPKPQTAARQELPPCTAHSCSTQPAPQLPCCMGAIALVRAAGSMFG